MSGGSIICQGSGAGTLDANGKAMTASSTMDIVKTWCNKFGEEQLKVSLKDVQYNPISNFNLFIIEKVIQEGWKVSGDQEGLILMKDIAKLDFDIKIMTKLV